MIYELRCYVPVPGREKDLRNRFAGSTLPLFAELGIRVVEFWERADGNGELWYLLAWEGETSMRETWKAFREDPRWLAIRQASESDGPLTQSITSTPLRRVDFGIAHD